MKTMRYALLASLALNASLSANDPFDIWFEQFFGDKSMLADHAGTGAVEDDVLIDGTTHYRAVFAVPAATTRDAISVKADHRNQVIAIKILVTTEETTRNKDENSEQQSVRRSTSTMQYSIPGEHLDLRNITARLNHKHNTLTIMAPYIDANASLDDSVAISEDE
jgi:hypothetical protein